MTIMLALMINKNDYYENINHLFPSNLREIINLIISLVPSNII